MTPENEMSKKFDENKWRILAMNRPDELHSYVPRIVRGNYYTKQRIEVLQP